jgi:hypothetical protein
LKIKDADSFNLKMKVEKERSETLQEEKLRASYADARAKSVQASNNHDSNDSKGF